MDFSVRDAFLEVIEGDPATLVYQGEETSEQLDEIADDLPNIQPESQLPDLIRMAFVAGQIYESNNHQVVLSLPENVLVQTFIQTLMGGGE